MYINLNHHKDELRSIIIIFFVFLVTGLFLNKPHSDKIKYTTGGSCLLWGPPQKKTKNKILTLL
jgi:hypothetical protein